MGRRPGAAYLWPGLAGLLERGSLPSLAVACGFGILLDLALAATLVWDELLGGFVRNSLWATVIVCWLGAAAMVRLRGGPESPLSETADTGEYQRAVDHYLKGDWFQAEQLLVKLVRRNSGDLEAGLMLATLFRHTGRLGEAERRLARLERVEGWWKWELEIRRERQLLAEARTAENGSAEPAAAA